MEIRELNGRTKECRSPVGVVRTRWRSGPDASTDGSVLVSMTDFTSDTFRDLPGIARAGFELRRAWPQLEGAIGMWLWAEPLARRTGSVSVWSSEEALRRFVRWPAHTAIMRKYRGRGAIRATTWWAENVDQTDIWRSARSWLAR